MPDPATLQKAVDEGSFSSLASLFQLRPSDVRARHQARFKSVLEAIRKEGGLCIYGAGNIGRQALDAARRADIPIKQILDRNPSRFGGQLDGVPIRSPEHVVSGDVVVIGVGNGVAEIEKALQKSAHPVFLGLSELNAVSRRPGEPETDYIDDLFANRCRYVSLYGLLDDAESRETLSALVQHRLTLSNDSLQQVRVKNHDQWFAPFLSGKANEVFVDGGAFDGDTVEGYIKSRGAGYGAIHAFEIDPDIAKRARERVAGYRDVTVHNVGLSDRQDDLAYRRTGGTDGTLSLPEFKLEEHGDRSDLVRISRLDDVVQEAVDFIKLDVEGEEARAIAGAEKHILRSSPILAVAAYHKASDIWDLPRRLLDLTPGYRLRLRHYTDCAYETVIYATRASPNSDL